MPPISWADFFYHRKADATSIAGCCAGGVAPVKHIKQPGQLLRLYAHAVVGKGDRRHAADFLRRDADMNILPPAVFAAVVQ